jgi:cytochrome P450
MTGAIARWLLSRGADGFDVRRIESLPDRTLLPLLRNGLDPVPALREARERAPVIRLPAPLGLRVWLVSGYDPARGVLGDAGGHSTDFANLIGGPSVTNPGGLGFADPPAHTRLRHLLTPEFTMRRLARLAPRIDEIIRERLDAIAHAPDQVDLVSEYALPVPSLVICELLGVPFADRAHFQQMAMNRFDVDTGATRSLHAISDSLAYLRTVVDRQRADPGDGLIGMIIRDHGHEVSDEELAGLADGVLTGGFETTASMIALGALALLQNDEAFDRLRRDDLAVAPFVEEALRYLSVVQVAFPRFARRDMTVGGVHIAAGDMMVVSLAGANRDPALTTTPEYLDPTRTPVSHLAFGHGIHRCVGAELARMELRVAYRELVRRFPRLRLAVPVRELTFRRASIVYGLASLPVWPAGVQGVP